MEPLGGRSGGKVPSVIIVNLLGRSGTGGIELSPSELGLGPRTGFGGRGGPRVIGLSTGTGGGGLLSPAGDLGGTKGTKSGDCTLAQ